MKKHLFSQKGKFYKANLHCHTTVSDGRCSPEEIKRRYKEMGYSIIAFTDHVVMVDHSDLNDESFLALKGYEIHVNADEPSDWNYKKTYHLNFIAKDKDKDVQVCFNPRIVFSNARAYVPFVKYQGDFYDYKYSPDCINDMIRIANENGFLVNYNHPKWSLQDYRDYGSLRGLYGVEVFNGSCVPLATYDDNASAYAEMIRNEPSLIPLAVDDNHNINGFDTPYCDSFRGFNMIKAESLSYSDVIDALLRGDTYASTGPEIYELYVEDGTVYIKTSPVCDIALVTNGRNGVRVRKDNGEEIYGAEFAIDETNTPFRIEMTDKNGKKAYTRMYTLDECK
ncbi:MAG: PHP domain-containing protein [Clostridia bacterium]|nr:PHP domain-containing protein [Clostridia bacterium]